MKHLFVALVIALALILPGLTASSSPPAAAAPNCTLTGGDYLYSAGPLFRVEGYASCSFGYYKITVSICVGNYVCFSSYSPGLQYGTKFSAKRECFATNYGPSYYFGRVSITAYSATTGATSSKTIYTAGRWVQGSCPGG